jgi:nanoRNase/pAp phosphatase (c-di-AMP/oligoRNAs hydrolase)
MGQPFPKSTSLVEKCTRLRDVVTFEDTLGVLINADPDSIASAIALKRIFWRKVKKTIVYHINTIQRADNLSLIKLLKIELRHSRHLEKNQITKWAIIDSQPRHDPAFGKINFDIIIDHHPIDQQSSARFMDIREDYGACSTILTEYLRALKIKPSPRLATALFYGIKTDTDNFARPSLPNDINAFRYLYEISNLHIIKKIESSELSKKTLPGFRKAMDNIRFVRDIAFIHMGNVNSPDMLVMVADFFLKMAEASWCIVSGVYLQKLIVIFRNAGFRRDAGKMAVKAFGQWGSAGGHQSAARAEIPLKNIEAELENKTDISQFVIKRIKEMR